MTPGEAPVRRRRALLIASARYSDRGLASLRAPTGDVQSLAEVLGDEGIGAFEVQQLVDEPTDAIKKRIEDFFRDSGRNDLLLLYFSGHGVLSLDRKFYFATVSTELEWVKTTGIEDRFVKEAMDSSRARSIVLVLDCCHSGAFGKGLVPKSALSADVEHRFDGEGRVTLTASNALEYAFEESDPATGINELEPAEPGSLFTRCVVEGLRSGAADVDDDGAVSVDDLYDYVKQQVRERSTHQTPRMSGDVSGDIFIARSPRKVTLPPELAAAVRNTLAGVRLGAVGELAALMESGPPPLAAVARETLERLAAEDDSRRVSEAAHAALGTTPPPQPPPTQPSPTQPTPREPSGPRPLEPGPGPGPGPGPRPLPKPWWRSRAALIAAGAVAAAAAAIVAVPLLTGGDDPRTGGDVPNGDATLWDFNADGNQDIVLGAASGSGRDGTPRAGSVVVHTGDDEARLISATDAGIPGPHAAGDRFGAALASGDFDRDGLADLAIGAPGRDLVSVLYGTGSREIGRVALVRGDAVQGPPEIRAFGFALVAADFDGNGYADLAVGTPGSPAQRSESEPGVVHLLFGGPEGLSAARSRRLDGPQDYQAGFGRFLAAGDLDDDGDVELVEGTMDEPDLDVTGHASVCLGTPTGPRSCELLGDRGYGTSGLAVARVDDDRFADVVQGDKAPWDGNTPPEYVPAQVRLWRGNRDGRPESPIERVAGEPGMPIPEEEGDEFAHSIDAGDVDGDGLADIVVGARYHGFAGAVAVLRGASDGIARSGNFDLQPDRTKSAETFGEAVSLLHLDGDGRLDLVVGVAKVENADQAVVSFMNSPSGLGGETPVRGLADLVELEDTPLRIGG